MVLRRPSIESYYAASTDRRESKTMVSRLLDEDEIDRAARWFPVRMKRDPEAAKAILDRTTAEAISKLNQDYVGAVRSV